MTYCFTILNKGALAIMREAPKDSPLKKLLYYQLFTHSLISHRR